MRPWFVHLIILVALAILGIAIYLMETLTPASSGGLFLRYDATKLYWLGFMGYSSISTFIVLSVFVTLKFSKSRFNAKTVILSHILPIGVVWISLQLGIHDFIQNAWQKKRAVPGKKAQQRFQEYSKKRLKIPPSAPLKTFDYKESNGQVELHKQVENLAPDANSQKRK